jgi:hypothetical protein
MRHETSQHQTNDDAWLMDDARPVKPSAKLRDTLNGAHRPAGAPRKSYRSAFAYGLLGFILGAVFWHFVGFWDFLGQLLFKGGSTTVEFAQAPPAIKLKDRVALTATAPFVLAASAEACTNLRLDRTTGETIAGHCEGMALPLRSLKAAKREDLRVTANQRMIETTARGWGVMSVESPPIRSDQASAD